MLTSKHYIGSMGKDKTTSLKDYARQFASKGGRVRAEQLTAQDRKRIARKAALARWGKQRPSKPKGE
jgi:hypothetical protein